MDQLSSTLGEYGPVRISKHSHNRVMPEGVNRIILFVEDGPVKEPTVAPAKTEPAKAKPVKAKPKPVEKKPVEAKPVEVKPAEAMQTETEPVERLRQLKKCRQRAQMKLLLSLSRKHR